MELIGERVEVVEAKNPSLVGLSGTVVDETRDTLVLEGGKRIIKDQAVFRLVSGGRAYRFPGSAIAGRPEDRIRKKFRRW